MCGWCWASSGGVREAVVTPLGSLSTFWGALVAASSGMPCTPARCPRGAFMHVCFVARFLAMSPPGYCPSVALEGGHTSGGHSQKNAKQTSSIALAAHSACCPMNVAAALQAVVAGPSRAAVRVLTGCCCCAGCRRCRGAHQGAWGRGVLASSLPPLLWPCTSWVGGCPFFPVPCGRAHPGQVVAGQWRQPAQMHLLAGQGACVVRCGRSGEGGGAGEARSEYSDATDAYYGGGALRLFSPCTGKVSVTQGV
jgi:hypothetical protein